MSLSLQPRSYHEGVLYIDRRIEELIRVGHLRKFVRKDHLEWSPPCRQSLEHNPKKENHGIRQKRESSKQKSWSSDCPLRGHINTISKGIARGGSSSSSRKRLVHNAPGREKDKKHTFNRIYIWRLLGFERLSTPFGFSTRSS